MQDIHIGVAMAGDGTTAGDVLEKLRGLGLKADPAVIPGDEFIRKERLEREKPHGRVLVVDGPGHSTAHMPSIIASLLNEVDVIKCCDPEDPDFRPINRPWYNDMRPGGKKSHRGKRNRSGNHW